MSEDEINQYLSDHPIVLGSLALVLGLTLLGFGIKALLSGRTHSKYGQKIEGPRAHVIGALLTGFGGHRHHYWLVQNSARIIAVRRQRPAL